MKLVFLGAAVFVPCQALHHANHRLAIGASRPVVWMLMLFDGLFVGLMATLIGASLFVSYGLPARTTRSLGAE